MTRAGRGDPGRLISDDRIRPEGHFPSAFIRVHLRLSMISADFVLAYPTSVWYMSSLGRTSKSEMQTRRRQSHRAGPTFDAAPLGGLCMEHKGHELRLLPEHSAPGRLGCLV
jgi:hypothetical protein